MQLTRKQEWENTSQKRKLYEFDKTADSQQLSNRVINSSVFLANRCQNNVDNRLLRAANCNLHGDTVSQSQAGPDQCVMIASEHTWETKKAKWTVAL